MNDVLYRKYRSRTFAEVIGQSHVVELLAHAVENNKLSHAYLFSGPRGTGKTTLARLMAKAVNCSNFAAKKDICNECEYCKLIDSMQSSDIVEMDAASNRGIEEIRSLKESVNYLPSFLKKKIYIIDEAHMLTREAFNALLKTLEEPPSHIIFMLATTEVHKLPVTILSRVQRFDLKLASEEELIKKLEYILKQENLNMKKDALSAIYRHSGGSFRDAETLLSKVIVTADKTDFESDEVFKILGLIPDRELNILLDFVFAKKETESITLFKNLVKEGYTVGLIIDQLMGLIKYRMVDSPDLDVRVDLSNLANSLIQLKKDIKEFQDKNLIFELWIVRSCLSSHLFDLSIKKAVEAPIKREVELQSKELSSEEVEVKPAGAGTQNINGIFINAGKKFPQVERIAERSRVEILNNTVYLYNPYKINIAYLNRSDVKGFIVSLIKSMFGEGFSFETAIEQKKETEAKKVENDQENKAQGAALVKDVKDSSDNSALIEEILFN